MKPIVKDDRLRRCGRLSYGQVWDRFVAGETKEELAGAACVAIGTIGPVITKMREYHKAKAEIAARKEAKNG